MRWFFKRHFQQKGNDGLLEEWAEAGGSKDGTLVEKLNRRDECVAFQPSLDHLRGHSLIYGNLGTGKTTFIDQLASAAIQNGDAFVAIDLEGDLVPNIVRRIPPSRAKDVCWIDMKDPTHVPGFNLLDVSHGEPSNLIVLNLMHTARTLWGDYWKPDVEDALCTAVRTLIAANRVLARRHEPQFTLLDVHQLFDLPNFCRQVVEGYLDDRELISWWNSYVERPGWLNRFDFAALLSPLGRLTGHPFELGIGQSESAFNLRERLAPGRVTLFDLSSITSTYGLRSWLAALIADRINLTALAIEPVITENGEPHIVIAIDGNLPIPRLDEPGYLADLREHLVNYILPHSHAGPMLQNPMNLFVFRTIGCYAEELAGELGEGLSMDDILGLRLHEFYLGSFAGNRAFAVKRFTMEAPLKSEPTHAADAAFRGDSIDSIDLPKHIQRCGRRASEIRTARKQFEQTWYGAERAALLNRRARTTESPSSV